MALAVVLSRGLAGLEAPLVTVEVHLAGGLPAFNLVGLPDTEVKESRDRVRAALQNAQFDFPARKITVQWLYKQFGDVIDALLPLIFALPTAAAQRLRTPRCARRTSMTGQEPTCRARGRACQELPFVFLACADRTGVAWPA